MLIGVAKRFVFVANTKTASSSIEALLAPHAEISRPGGPAAKHSSIGQIRYVYSFLFNQPDHAPETFFTFGVMRDPIDWIGSWYRFRRGNKVEAPLPRDLSFRDFWARQDWNIRRGDGTPNLQSNLFCNYRGEVMVDMILPYERLNDLFPRVLQGLGIAGALPQLNVSALGPETLDIPADLVDQMRAHYAPDYALRDRMDRLVEQGFDRLHAIAASRGGQA